MILSNSNPSSPQPIPSSELPTSAEIPRFQFPTGTTFFNIKWENFNYPPFLKLIHYDPTELADPEKTVIINLNRTFLITILVSIINFINCIAQTAAGLGGIRILYSILNMVLFWPVSLFAFYKGYRGLVYNRSDFRLYWPTHFLLACAFVILSIVHAGNYNGWVRMAELFDEGYVFQGLLSIVESLIYEFNAIFVFYCMWKVHKLSQRVPKADRL